MKRYYLFSSLLFGFFIASFGVVNAQHNVHPDNYSAGVSGNTNFFLDYVGERFLVTAPSAVAGEKQFTTPNDNSGTTGVWGGFPGVGTCPPISNTPLITNPTDSLASSAITISMTGKVALLFRGGGIEFGAKALAAENAGAIGCVIVNNVDGGPVGMGAGAVGASVTIPVFMISKADGYALNSQILAGTTVTVSIFTWGQGNVNDLGLVSGGLAQWHNAAIPAYELATGGDPSPYKGFDGAYVANFGTADLTNISLSARTTYTPAGGSSSIINTTTTTLASFPAADSIWAIFGGLYNLGGAIAGSGPVGPGTLDVNYSVTSTATSWVDQFPFDNSASYSVQLTDNIYCKGRWDNVNNRPFCTYYTGPGANSGGTYDPYIWGPTFYVKTPKYAYQSMFSIVESNTALVWVLPSATVSIYLLRWADGTGATTTADSLIQAGELQLMGIGSVTFNGTTDSSFKYYTVTYNGDTTGTGNYSPHLGADSMYWVAVEMEQTGSTNMALGCDGVNNGLPRTFGRFTDPANKYYEYYAPLWAGGDRSASGATSMFDNPGSPSSLVPFGGTFFVNTVDSSIFPREKGLIPNVSLSTSMWSVNTENVKTKATEFKLYPVPAANEINVSLGLEKPAAKVTYKIMNSAGKIISTETRTNVQSEIYTFSTCGLSNGNYYMIINADDRNMFKKFSVMH